MKRLLAYRAPRSPGFDLPFDLRLESALYEAKAVQVLQLRLRAQGFFTGLADRYVGVAAQRTFLHVHVRHPDLSHRGAKKLEEFLCLRRRAQIGLGDDLDERGAAAVEVDDRLAGPMDPSGLPDVDELGRVFLQVHPPNPNSVAAGNGQLAPLGQRHVVLTDLVALREVGVEVVLSMEDGPRRDGAFERERDHQTVVDGLRVQHR